MTQIHATCVSWRGGGILLLGPSGSGKSDLALRLIRAGATLVADDRCILHRVDDGLIARAPAALAGLMEVRGLGILTMPHMTQERIDVIIELAAHRGGVDRLPEPRTHDAFGVTLPCWRLHPFDVSSEIKVDLALSLARGEVLRKW